MCRFWQIGDKQTKLILVKLLHNNNSVVSLTQYKNQRDNPIDAENSVYWIFPHSNKVI